ncbi:hypothetical protein EMCRGX_G017918 [Ephydatia muelleri]
MSVLKNSITGQKQCNSFHLCSKGYPEGYTFVYCLGPCQGPPSDVGNTDIQRLQELAHKPIRHLKCF